MKLLKRLTKPLCLLLTSIFLITVPGCTSTNVKSPNLVDDIDKQSVTGKDADATLVDSQMHFALNLFQAAVSENKTKNVLISPLSVMLALSMTANGAASETKTEMEQVLAKNFTIEELNEYLYTYVNNLPSNKDTKLQLANSIWIRDDEKLTMKEGFLQNTAAYYDSAVYKSAFDQQTVCDINAWINENTNGMIKKVLEKIDEDTMLYLINALTFDAEWENTYKSNAIRNGEFTSIGGDVRKVEMMHSSEHYYIDTGNAVGFIKNYKDENYRFAALLPNENISIADYIEGLQYDELLKTLEEAQQTEVRATIPKFSYDYDILLNDVLKSLGMSTAFDGINADFSAMGEYLDENLYINKVIHKTHITVDGLGTKAGAVTVVEMNKESATELPDSKIVCLDRPFIYMILDGATNLPIFIGTVIDIN